jgi:pyridoxamine 5'-phosphate oxidase family protein
MTTPPKEVHRWPPDPTAFTAEKLSSLTSERRLARVATVGKDGTPQVVPVGQWAHNPEYDTIDVRGHGLDKTKKFRDVARSGRAAIVVDDLVSIDPWWRGRSRCAAARRWPPTPSH